MSALPRKHQGAALPANDAMGQLQTFMHSHIRARLHRGRPPSGPAIQVVNPLRSGLVSDASTRSFGLYDLAREQRAEARNDRIDFSRSQYRYLTLWLRIT